MLSYNSSLSVDKDNKIVWLNKLNRCFYSIGNVCLLLSCQIKQIIHDILVNKFALRINT